LSFWEAFLEESLRLNFENLLEAATDSGRVCFFAEEYRMMLKRLFDDPGIKRRCLELSKGDGSPEYLAMWIDSHLFNSTRVECEAGDREPPELPFGEIPGLDD